MNFGPFMNAMILEKIGHPLVAKKIPIPQPGPADVLIRVHACAVCRTDLHVMDGELLDAKLPLVPGHQIVGTVIRRGQLVKQFSAGDRVGVPWLGWTCNHCSYCQSSRENLCDEAQFTGYHRDGGYAEYVVADERFCFSIPPGYSDLQAAPLLCAGLIGYRSLKMTGMAKRLGFYGFGAASHILVQLSCYKGCKVYAFTRPGDRAGQQFALKLGAVWAGESTQPSPVTLDAAIIFAPVGALLPIALRSLAKGGMVVCAGIHMSDIPTFAYSILWGEKIVRSVANLTRRDAKEFLSLAPQVPIRTEVHAFALSSANQALSALRSGKLQGAAVLAVE